MVPAMAFSMIASRSGDSLLETPFLCRAEVLYLSWRHGVPFYGARRVVKTQTRHRSLRVLQLEVFGEMQLMASPLYFTPNK